MIELVEFSKKYKSLFSKKEFSAAESISFCVENGSVTGLIGANGSGKTTIIKAICGFHAPSSGKIFVTDYDGTKIQIDTQSHKAMQLIGYVPEKTQLPPDFYVKEFLHYCAKIHGMDGKIEQEAVERVISDCDLEEVLDKKIKKLSKGYGQRVSFAQALIHNPPNLILDEPITGLDPFQIISMRNLIENQAQKKAVLLSTHILQEVNSLCKNLCIMNHGKLAASGTETQIINQTGSNSLEEAFLKLSAKGGKSIE